MLGCGTAYFSAWLARRGARPAGVDVTPAQVESARRCQDRFGITFPLIEADAGAVPLPSGSFDLAISECGASSWCDPARWVPEAARLLRQGGKLVFHTTTILVTVCSPEPDGPARQELLRPQRHVQRRGEEYSSTAATVSGSRSCATAASSSTRCMSSMPRQMLPIIPTTHWRSPNGRASGWPRKYGLPTSPVDPRSPQNVDPLTLDLPAESLLVTQRLSGFAVGAQIDHSGVFLGMGRPMAYRRAMCMRNLASSSRISSPLTSTVTLWMVPVNLNALA